jgi:hypothetical protein
MGAVMLVRRHLSSALSRIVTDISLNATALMLLTWHSRLDRLAPPYMRLEWQHQI